MRVVLLNDGAIERRTMVSALERASHVVEAVADPKAALEAIARLSPQVVVVGVPEQGGAALVRMIRGAAAGQAYIVAVLDGTGGGRDISPILAAGATDFLRRPVMDAELVERVLAPKRLIRWANAVTRSAVFDLSSRVDIIRLQVWRSIGSIVATTLSEMFGQSLAARDGWPPWPDGALHTATIPMALASDEVELRLSLVADHATLAWISEVLLGASPAEAAMVGDTLRELTNVAGGALKRAALPENVMFTTGLPITDGPPVLFAGEGIQSLTVASEDDKICFGIVAQIRQRKNEQVPCSALREGMVVVNDLRNESGALLVAAGSRLTSSTAARLAQMLGRRRHLIEVQGA
jgi:CheY-like chemotaxis protein